MANPTARIIIASSIGITLSAFFVGGNLALTYIALPSLLLPSPPSPLPAPANSTNTSSPTSTSPPKPATPLPHLARQWQKIYRLGSMLGPAVAVGGSAAFIYTALQLPKAFLVQRRLFFAAAAMGVLVAPFTFTAMKHTNGELHRRANLAASGREEDDEMLEERAPGVERYRTPELVRWWGVLNVIRASLPLVGIGAAVTALAL